MKKSFLLIILLPIFAFVSCSKEENTVQPPAGELQLKASNCTPSVVNYENTFIIIPVFPPECFDETILWLPTHISNKGRLVVAASCRFNDRGSQTFIMSGTGSLSGHQYQAEYAGEYHFLGSLTGQGAQVTRLIQDAVFTNLSTGVTYTQSFILHQTINANGEITVDYVEYIPCEE